MSERMVALDHLPVEVSGWNFAGTLPIYNVVLQLLYDIYIYALSPALPLTCKHLHAVFKLAPPTVRAEWLISSYQESVSRYAQTRWPDFVSHVLRFRICTQEVLEAIWRNPQSPNSQPYQVTVLPRRFFRPLKPREKPGQAPWTDEDEPLPFLRYLCSHPRIPKISFDSDGGYALTRAVFAGFTPLIRFLLSQGASPECKGNLAVTVAIKRKSLPLVRMLIERDYHEVGADSAPSKKRRRLGGGRVSAIGGTDGGDDSPAASMPSPSGSGKRRKLGDRVTVTPDMLKVAVLCDARDIVEYFMKEKGCVPDMRTVLATSR